MWRAWYARCSLALGLLNTDILLLAASSCHQPWLTQTGSSITHVDKLVFQAKVETKLVSGFHDEWQRVMRLFLCHQSYCVDEETDSQRGICTSSVRGENLSETSAFHLISGIKNMVAVYFWGVHASHFTVNYSSAGECFSFKDCV